MQTCGLLLVMHDNMVIAVFWARTAAGRQGGPEGALQGKWREIGTGARLASRKPHARAGPPESGPELERVEGSAFLALRLAVRHLASSHPRGSLHLVHIPNHGIGNVNQRCSSYTKACDLVMA